MGRIETKEILIPYTGRKRRLFVYLPDAYDSTNACFPVLYMHDGQNVLTDEFAFGGHSWRVAETLSNTERRGETTGIIVAALENDGENRMDEYSPWKSDFSPPLFFTENTGGKGREYADFFAGALKIFVDGNYRTNPGREHTAVAGSSMGGLISAYIAAEYPDVFGAAGIFSPATWVCRDAFMSYMKGRKLPPSQKYYVYVGTAESSDPSRPEFPRLYLDSAKEYANLLPFLGIPPCNLKFDIASGETHAEPSWAKYLSNFIFFCF